MLKFPYVCLCAVLLLETAQGAKILAVFNVPAYSHYHLGHRLLEELALKGHEVTMISAFGKGDFGKNYHNVYVEGSIEYMDGFMKDSKTTLADFAAMSPYANYMIWQDVGYHMTEFTMKSPNVQRFIADKPHFDAVIVEQFFNDALKVYCHHFNASCIALSTIGSNHMINNLVANPSPYSYVVDTFLPYGGVMNMLERADNLIFQHYATLVNYFYFEPRQQKLLNEIFPQAPPLSQLKHNIALMLMNSHPSTNQPVPHVPIMIEIGGYHVKGPKRLPDDLKKLLDDAQHGAIYISFGSHIRSTDLPEDKRNVLMRVFSNLKQTVLWKFENEALPGKPDNVIVSKWFPQSDILAHKNIKLFITHGGLLSTLEAVVRGVPLIGIPILGDQKLNMARTVQSGFGLQIYMKDLTEENLRAQIQKILTDDFYSKNAKKRGALIQDRPMKPTDTATYWIEYVIRHNGAEFLRVTGVYLAWYKYYMLDVITVSVMIIFFIKWIFTKIYSFMFHAKKHNKVKKM